MHPNDFELLVVIIGSNGKRIFFACAVLFTGKGQGYPGTFKDNMQQIVDAVKAASKDIRLAKPSIALGDGSSGGQFVNIDTNSRNVLIREYNDVIDELIADPNNNFTITATDFYTYFSETDPTTGNRRYIDQYSDNLHPNGTGCRSMAELWY